MTIERLNIMTIIALLATVMLLAGCSVLDDDKIRLRNGMPIWSYSYSYTINGQYVRYDDWDVIKHTDSFLLWNVERFYKFIPSLDGQTLYLYLSSNSSPHRVVLNFWSEDGPLKEGVNYPIDQAFAIYDAWTSSTYDKSADGVYGEIGVKLLSGSFRLDYSENDASFIKEVLDLYFDFEEVITSVPDDINYNGPSVGDIIRVSGGHFSQNLYFLDPDNLDDISRMPNRAYPFDISTLKTIIIPE